MSGRRVWRRGIVAAVAVTTVVAGSMVAFAATHTSAVSVDLKAWYLLINRDSGKVMAGSASATKDGAAVVQSSRRGGNEEQWRFIDSGGGYYELQNRKSGKVLDDYRWSRAAGTPLVQWSDHHGGNQQFKLAQAGGYVRLINRFSGMAVAVDGAAKAGGKVVQRRDGGGAALQWKLVAAGPAATPTTTGGTTSPGHSSSPSSPGTGGATRTPTPLPSSAHPSPTAGPGSATKQFMGSSTVLVGGSMSDSSAAAAPFDLQYSYVHSRPAPTTAAYTATRCDPAWSVWWGCWTGPTTAPGFQITLRENQVAQVTYQGKPRPQKILFTWYSLRDLGDLAGLNDGTDEVKVINRADLLTRYLNDYRFFLRTIGKSQDLIDLEPDFWGFARALGNLHQVPAQVRSANPTDCGSQENSASGLAQCLIAMARKYAPNAGVGLHLSCFDWQTDVKKCQSDYRDLGAQAADFVVSDISDRDAGWYAQPAHGGLNTFWTDQKAAAALGFYKTMSETIGKPVVLWQIPVGNMAQNNTPNHYQDDKVDWLFSHMKQVADAHVAALLFGAGWQEQTTPETDGRNLISKTIAYRNAGGVALK